MDTAAKFAALFPAYSRAHGVFRALGHDDRGKVKGRAITIEGPPDYAAHLAGTEPQGAIPLLDDCSVQWAAIDVDDYDTDMSEVAARITKHKLPLVPCASKSGGVHLYLFLKEPQPAELVRRYLSHCSAQLGFGGSEIFPKQSERASPADIGNWINLPYWHSTERRAYHDGQWLSLDEFLEHAEASRAVVPETAPRRKRAGRKADDPLDGCPPCLRCHMADGVPDGHKHEHLFTLVTYCRKRWPDEWKARVHELQRLLFKPALTHDDVERNLKSMGKKEYDYECKGPWCDKQACRAVAHGSGNGTGDLIDAITKLVGDPVLWAVELGGKRVLVTSDQLQSQALFNRVCMDAISRCPAQVPTPRWLQYIDAKIRDADVVEAPADVSPRGQFEELLAHFVDTAMRRARAIKEITLGKVWLDPSGMYQFRMMALFEFLDERRFRYKSTSQVWAWLKDIGARSRSLAVDGSMVKVCELPVKQETASGNEQAEV